jgi:hypothetical protein
MKLAFALLAVALVACSEPDPLAREPWRALVTIDDAGVSVRLLYEPEDGGTRERRLAVGERIPWPRDAVEGTDTFDRPATVLRAGPDQPWNDLLLRLPKDRRSWVPRLYLSAKGRDGRTRTLPVNVHSVSVSVVPDSRRSRSVAPDRSASTGDERGAGT